jgi:hypothetical protein
MIDGIYAKQENPETRRPDPRLPPKDKGDPTPDRLCLSTSVDWGV